MTIFCLEVFAIFIFMLLKQMSFIISVTDWYFTYSALYFSQIRSLFTRHIADQSSTIALEYFCIHFITLNMTRLVADTTFRLLTPFLSRTNSFAPWQRLLQRCAARTRPPSPRPPPPCLPEPGELGEVAVLDGGQGQALVSVAQLGVPVARLLALASSPSPPRHTRCPAR